MGPTASVENHKAKGPCSGIGEEEKKYNKQLSGGDTSSISEIPLSHGRITSLFHSRSDLANIITLSPPPAFREDKERTQKSAALAYNESWLVIEFTMIWAQKLLLVLEGTIIPKLICSQGAHKIRTLGSGAMFLSLGG